MQVEQSLGSVPTHARDQTLSQLRRAEQQLAEAQALAHVGSWDWDLINDQLTWSDEHYRIFGLEPQACPVRYPSSLQYCHPDDRARLQRLAEQALADHQPYSCEFRIVRPDGSERIAEAHARVEVNAAGRPTRMHGTVQDVTERGRAQDARRHLLARAISAQEEERRRVARELHDETGQALSAILVGLRNVEDADTLAEARSVAGRLRRLAAETVRDVGRIARGLHPSILDDLGLIPALRRYGEELGAARHFTVRIVDDTAGRLPTEVETTLYRIAQEALTNVARHARAAHATVVIERCEGGARATIQDDGTGFDVRAALRSAAQREALGLLGMQERAGLLGGTVTFESRPGAGVTITVTLPVP